EVIKIQKDLVKIVETENYIDEKNFDNARDELRNLNGKLETLEGKEAREELREKLKIKEKEEEERLKALVEEKREFLEGYWLIDSGIWIFKKAEKTQYFYTLRPEGGSFVGLMDNMTYDEKANMIKVIDNYDEDGIITSHELGKVVDITIEGDDNLTIKIDNDPTGLKAKRISQKDAVAYMYGYALASKFEKDAYVFGIENFEEKAEADKTYTEEMAIEFFTKRDGTTKEDYLIREKKILPGYTSYEVENKKTGGTEYIFEGNLTQHDFLEKYNEYARENNITY
ncbi:MAG: hypothetical protein ACRC28_14760, partial [Clostridium sp.]|uniref:hypothetical protein n=1 Tax=Clostridium sp. TaxID=1506 RepID=UPI003F3F3D8D